MQINLDSLLEVGARAAPAGAGPQLPPGEHYLPVGRVEAVRVIDEVRRVGGMGLRVSFDLQAFQTPKERVWKGRVMHVVEVLVAIGRELRDRGCQPVYLGKRAGDEFEVGLWKAPGNPAVLVEAAGWPISSVFGIEWGTQCVKGFDPALSVIEDWSKFPVRKVASCS